MTIVQKVCKLLGVEKHLSLQEIYERLPEHTPASIRGNINRYLQNCSEPAFTRVGKGLYAVVEIVKVEERDDGKLNVSYAASYYNGTNEVHFYHKDYVAEADAALTPGEYCCFDKFDSFDELSEHQASICGIFQSGDVRDILKRLKDNSFDLLVTDPPYRVISGGNGNAKAPKGMLKKNDGKIFAFNDISFDEWLPDCFRVLKDGAHAYIFTNFLNLEALLAALRKVGFDLHNLLVWEKNNANPNRWYMKNHEYVVLARKGKAKAINHCGSKTVHLFKNILGKKMHETEKPVDLLQFYIENSSQEGEWVLDPFAGSGSTAEAALRSGRRFMTCELDGKYVPNIHQRLLAAL